MPENLPAFFEPAYALCAEGKSRKAVGWLLDALDDLCLDGAFAECDALLPLADLERLDATACIGLLSAVYIARERLPGYGALVDRVEAALRTKVDPARAEVLVRGLRR